MLEKVHNDRFALGIRRLVDEHWETVRLLDGTDVAALSPAGREVLRLVMQDMRRIIDGLAGGLHDGEWSDVASPGLGRSIEDLHRRIEQISEATEGRTPA